MPQGNEQDSKMRPELPRVFETKSRQDAKEHWEKVTQRGGGGIMRIVGDTCFIFCGPDATIGHFTAEPIQRQRQLNPPRHNV